MQISELFFWRKKAEPIQAHYPVQPPAKFKAGDVVYPVAGGPLMTVSGAPMIGSGVVYVSYFRGYKLIWETISEESLYLAQYSDMATAQAKWEESVKTA